MHVTVCHESFVQFVLLHRLCNNGLVTVTMAIAGLSIVPFRAPLIFSFKLIYCRVEPVVAQPVAAEPVPAEATAAAAEAEVSPAVEVEAAAVDIGGPNEMERALAAEQVTETMCMACQVVET